MDLSSTQPSPTNSGTDAQRTLHQQLDFLIQSALDYAFITFTPDVRVTGWSRGAERILGYSEAEILGQSGDVFFTTADREKGEPEREAQTARREGRAADERWHVKKDGSCFWALGELTLLRDDSGKPIGFGKVLRDLTDRKRAEEALRQSEQRFRLLVENVRDHAIFDVNLDGVVSSWNSGAEELFGYKADEIIGQPLAILFLPEDRDTNYASRELARTLAEGRVEDARWLVRKDGTRFFAEWVTHLAYDDQGQLRGFAKVLRDETRRSETEATRKRLEEQERAQLQERIESTGAELDRTKEELRALAASLLTAQEDERRRISRELHDHASQRLAALEMTVVEIMQQPGIPEKLRSDLAPLRREIEATAEEIRQLSHRLHPAILEHLGLVPALRTVGEEFERLYDLALDFDSAGPERGFPLHVATALYRIAQEALRNAAKHAPGSLVTMRVSSTPEELRLTVEDDGPGFDVAAAESRRGLGLVSMEERARLVNGIISIKSAPGAGTTVEVRVPLPQAPEQE